MAQFDVYENKDPKSLAIKPYYLDIQTPLLDSLSTRTVIPLVLDKYLANPIQFLNPSFTVECKTVYLSTAEIRSTSYNYLGDNIISLAHKRNEILSAIEFLYSGI